MAAVGSITRGTTGVNRLRRIDRWIAQLPALRAEEHPLIVDLGYGANATTTLELWQRVSPAAPGLEVLGLEIDPARVAVAEAQLAEVRAGATRFDPASRITVRHGGFEVPRPPGRKASVIRAMNVLRQYAEEEVAAAWERMLPALAPHGLIVDGTCDELGRICSWIALGHDGPQSLSISLRLAELEAPSIVAERLPKALIHRNVPGERVHELMLALDRAWRLHAPLATFGAVQRWIAVCRTLREEGWPMQAGPRRWRLGEITIAWDAVAPRGPGDRAGDAAHRAT